MKRRDLFYTATGVALASVIPSRAFAAEEKMLLQPGQTVLFQGDSITDAGRDKDKSESLGRGYPSLIAPWASASHPETEIHFLNRGISGNRVVDLEGRWEKDCLGLEPDWLSILIGVNDTWRRYDKNDPTSVEDFEDGYRQLLDRAKEERETHFVLMEPFLLHVSDKISKMREDLDPKREAVKRIAKDYKAHFIPLDGLFQEACKHRDPEFWAKDGVHPSPAGHALIAQAWLETVGA